MEQKEINKKNKKILAIVLMMSILILSSTGATYAYFALSAINDNVINGTAAAVNLNLTVTRVAPDDGNGDTSYNKSTKVLVPQLNSTLSSAIASGAKCVDGNKNIACNVYQITIKNNSTSTVVLRGDLTFSYPSNSMTNLVWEPLTNATTINTTTYGTKFFKASTSVVNDLASPSTDGVLNSKLVTNLTLSPANNGTTCSTAVPSATTTSNKLDSCVATYFVVVWINETNDDQYGVDGNRGFQGTVKFESSNGTGLTSTFTS